MDKKTTGYIDNGHIFFRRFLANRLDEHGDEYKDAQIPVMWEACTCYFNSNVLIELQFEIQH